MSCVSLPSKEKDESFFSQVSLSYVLPVLHKGEELTINDYIPLRGGKNVDDYWCEFRDIWEEMVEREKDGKRERREEAPGEVKVSNDEDEAEHAENVDSLLHTDQSWEARITRVETEEEVGEEVGEVEDDPALDHHPLLLSSNSPSPPSSPSSSPSLLRALSLCILPSLSFSFLYRFLSVLFNFLHLLSMNRFFSFLFEEEKLFGEGLILCAALSATSLLCGCFREHSQRVSNEVGNKAKSLLCAAIFQKALRLSSTADGGVSKGEVVTLISADPPKIDEAIFGIVEIICSPIDILIYVTYLANILGIYPAMGALAIIAIFGYINAHSSSSFIKSSDDIRTYQQKRLAKLTEALQGILSVKMFGWEELIRRQIRQIRECEMTSVRSYNYLLACMSSVFASSDTLFAFASFSIYALQGKSLTAEVVFPAVYIFGMIAIPILLFPWAISSIFEASVSLDRLQKFFLRKEMSSAKSHNRDAPPCVRIKGTFGYLTNERDREEEDEFDGDDVADSLKEKAITLTPVTFLSPSPSLPSLSPSTVTVALKGINIKVPKGALVAIIGQVGSGKSTLLSSMLGEVESLDPQNSCVTLNGTIAYVPQTAWIRNATLRTNVTMCDADLVSEERYQRALTSCALDADLATLPAGDQTEIGERGYNLSGGQKQRVSLARAVYSDRDVYLLDDPLSAVDAHVARVLYEECICGALKGKTRVLVTHQVQFLNDEVDYLYVLRNGCVTAAGTFQKIGHKILELSVGDNDNGAQSASLSKSVDSSWDENEANVKNELDNYGVTPVTLVEEMVNVKVQNQSRGISKNEVDEDGRVTDDEEAIKGSVTLDVYWKYFNLAGGTPSILLYFFLTIVWEALVISTNVWLTIWIKTDDSEDVTQDFKSAMQNESSPVREGGHSDSAVTSSNEAEFLFGLIAICFCAIVLGIAKLFYATYCCCRASERLHDLLLWSVLRAPVAFHHRTPQGRLLNRFGSEMYSVDTEIPDRLNDTVVCLVWVVVSLCAVCVTCPAVLVMIGPITYAFYTIYRLYSVVARDLVRFHSISLSPIYDLFSEIVDGLPSIRAFDLSKSEERRFMDLLNRNAAIWMTQKYAECWCSLSVNLISTVFVFTTSLLCVTISMDYFFVTIPASLLALSVSYSLGITGELSYFMFTSALTESAMAEFQRINEFCDVESEDILLKTGVPKSWPATPSIQFRDVTLRYKRDGENVLNRLSFDIHTGEKIGIIGRTGAGKSSLMSVLLRIFEIEDDGKVTIDGRDIQAVGLHDLRHKISIIPQDPFLFSGTIRQNLDPFELFDDHEIWDAITSINVQSFVTSLDVAVSDGGRNFSAGQRQLLCIARALLNRSSIVLLDEATSSVDGVTDAMVQEALRGGPLKNCTVLTIAHRLHTVIDSDRILVLDRGSIESFGRPAELLGLVEGTTSRILCNFLDHMSQDSAAELRRIAVECLEGKEEGKEILLL